MTTPENTPEKEQQLTWLQWQKTIFMDWVGLALCVFMDWIFWYINILKDGDSYDIAFWGWEIFFLGIFIYLLIKGIILGWTEYKNGKTS